SNSGASNEFTDDIDFRVGHDFPPVSGTDNTLHSFRQLLVLQGPRTYCPQPEREAQLLCILLPVIPENIHRTGADIPQPNNPNVNGFHVKFAQYFPIFDSLKVRAAVLSS